MIYILRDLVRDRFWRSDKNNCGWLVFDRILFSLHYLHDVMMMMMMMVMMMMMMMIYIPEDWNVCLCVIFKAKHVYTLPKWSVQDVDPCPNRLSISFSSDPKNSRMVLVMSPFLLVFLLWLGFFSSNWKSFKKVDWGYQVAFLPVAFSQANASPLTATVCSKDAMLSSRDITGKESDSTSNPQILFGSGVEWILQFGVLVVKATCVWVENFAIQFYYGVWGSACYLKTEYVFEYKIKMRIRTY